MNKLNTYRVIVLVLVLFWAGLAGRAQTIARFEVEVSQSMHGIDEPIAIDLAPITFLTDTLLELVELKNEKRLQVHFQIHNGKQRTLNWILTGQEPHLKRRVYELIRSPNIKRETNKVYPRKENGVLTLTSGSTKLLQYNYKTVYPPTGIDTVFRRSGFIHPLWTPHGQELTRIQAPDHYHHYGLWNPWTHVLFEGDTIDFWNLHGRKGTVRFANFVSTSSGNVFGEYSALHEHVVFQKDGSEKVALNELQTVRAYRPNKAQDYYLLDITIEMNCATESPFSILKYRYAGLGWRATQNWNDNNSEVLTSENKTRKDADGTLARWFLIQGDLINDFGGALMMSHYGNYNHPEPLRIWPEDSNGGEVFAMFAPTKNRDWILEPNKTYTLKYRFVVFNGRFGKDKAESGWFYYNYKPDIKISKFSN